MTEYLSEDGDFEVNDDGDVVSAHRGVNAPKPTPMSRQWDHDNPRRYSPPNHDRAYGGDHIPPAEDSKLDPETIDRGKAAIEGIRQQFPDLNWPTRD